MARRTGAHERATVVITSRIDSVTLVRDTGSALLRAPKSVKIELCGRCNFRCQFCSLKDRDFQPKKDMDFAFFKRIVAEMRQAGVEEIGVFYIGESTLNPDLLVKAIAYVKDVGFPYCFLTTNGASMHQGLAKRCMEAGLDSLKFSINAADIEQFKTVMRVKPAMFEHALNNLRLARELRDEGGYKCGIYASSIQYDGEQAARMERLLDEHVRPWVDEHYFLPLFGQMTQLDAERSAQLGFVPTAGNQGRIGALRDPLPCWAVINEGHVRSDGHMSACCFGADDKFDMGDLNTQSFMEAWNSDVFQALRAAHFRNDVAGTPCADCVAYG